MLRAPLGLVQTVAFAAATGAITWQILSVLLRRGANVAPTVVVLCVAAGATLGAVVFARVVMPLRERLAARADPSGYPTSLLLVHMAVAAVWTLAWSMRGSAPMEAGIPPFACYFLAGLTSPLFYFPVHRRRQRP